MLLEKAEADVVVLRVDIVGEPQPRFVVEVGTERAGRDGAVVIGRIVIAESVDRERLISGPGLDAPVVVVEAMRLERTRPDAEEPVRVLRVLRGRDARDVSFVERRPLRRDSKPRGLDLR